MLTIKPSNCNPAMYGGTGDFSISPKLRIRLNLSCKINIFLSIFVRLA